jgi:hypothetical protein
MYLYASHLLGLLPTYSLVAKPVYAADRTSNQLVLIHASRCAPVHKRKS